MVGSFGRLFSVCIMKVTVLCLLAARCASPLLFLVFRVRGYLGFRNPFLPPLAWCFPHDAAAICMRVCRRRFLRRSSAGETIISIDSWGMVALCALHS